MDPLVESFIDYDDNFINFDLLRDANFYVASPDSASTKTKTNSHSPELQNSFPSSEHIFFEQTPYMSNFPPQTSESPPQSIISNNNGYNNQHMLDSAAFQANFNEKTADKSKRITKRNIAKERTKNRQEATITLSVHNGYGQEIVENQDIDDIVQKKMALKMKNRIAAQNSRDRKKVYTHQLEEANENLIQENLALHKEKDALLNQISKLQQNEVRLVKEIETLKTNITCPSCGKQSNKGPSYDEESNNNFYPISYGQPIPENSGSLSSPILARFPSAGRKMFTFLTLACFTALILLANVHQKGEVQLSGPLTLQDRGLLEFKGEVLEQHKDIDSDDEHDHDNCNRQESLLASTTEKLKDLIDTGLTKVLSQLEDNESNQSLSRQNSVNKNEIEWDQVCLKASDSDSANTQWDQFSFDTQESDSCRIEHVEAEEVLFLKNNEIY